MNSLVPTRRWLPALPLLLLLPSVAAPDPPQETASFQIIVHPDNPVSELDRRAVSALLLKKKTRWDHGPVAEPVDLEPNSPVRAAFSKAVHGRSVSSIKNYWQRQAFSGRSEPPPELADDAAVIAHVRSRPEAIGYVSAGARVDDVKVVLVTDG